VQRIDYGRKQPIGARLKKEDQTERIREDDERRGAASR